MKIRSSFILIIILVSISLNSYILAENEKEYTLLYTENIKDGGILETFPVMDMEQNIHVFVHLRTSVDDKLVVLYSDGSKLIQANLLEDVSLITFYDSFIYNDNLFVIFSAVNPLGTISFYEYSWSPSSNRTIPIVSIASSILPYINYFKVVIDNGTTHLFFNRYYGDDNRFMNITHYYGREGSFKKEYFSISNPYYRVGLDFVVNNGTIYYFYQKWEDSYNKGEFKGDFGFGILDNKTFYPLIVKKFSNDVVGEVGKFDAEKGSNDKIFTFAFFEKKRMFYGWFNGTHVTNTTQSILTQDNYYDFSLNTENNTEQMILITKSEGMDYVSIFRGKYNNLTLLWEFQPVTTSEKISPYSYSFTLFDSSYLLLYNSTICTKQIPHPIGLQYKNETAISLILVTNIQIASIEPIIDNGLQLYNPFTYFVKNNIPIVIAICVLIVIIFALLAILWIRKAKAIKSFFYDTSEVGEHKKFILFFLNINRYLYNFFSTVKTIGFSNKKRTLITLAGFIITGYLLGSAIIISQSEQSSLVKSYYSANNIISDGKASVSLVTNIVKINEGSVTVAENYDSLAKSQIRSIISDLTISKYITSIESAYYSFVRAQHPTVDYNKEVKISSLPDDSEAYLSSVITEGRIPQSDNEILIKGSLFRDFELSLNSNISVILSQKSVLSDEVKDYTVNLTIVGIFEQVTTSELYKTSLFLGESNDIFGLLETSQIVLYNSNLFKLLSNSKKLNMQLRGIYQFNLKFSNFKIEERTIISKEYEKHVGITYSLSHDASSAIVFTQEIIDFFTDFNRYYLNNMTRLFIFAFPAILLSIFMIFESSELFSSSYQQEVAILKNRGVRRRTMVSIYVWIRFFEVIIATIISYGIAILTSIPLIRINGFLSFNNMDTELRIGNLPVEMLLTALILFTISIPRILLIVRRERRIEKTPSKLSKLFKSISWRELSFLLIGMLIFGVFYYLTFVAYIEASTKNFPLFLNLTIIGALFTLIGALPLLMKFLSIIWKGIGTVIWNSEKKNKFRFVFAEISKDIKYFENITLIFLLLIGIIIPSIIVPFSKEKTLTNQAYFMNGAELMVPNWHKYSSGISIENITAIEGVDSASYVRLYTMYSDYNLGYHGTKIMVINTTSFLQTVRQPPTTVVKFNWQQLASLTKDTVIISRTLSEKYKKEVGDEIFLIHPDATFDTKYDKFVHKYNHTMTVISTFDLFPIFFLEKDKQDEELMMIVTAECFDTILKNVVTRRLLTSSALLIKPTSQSQIGPVAQQVFEISGGAYVQSFNSLKDNLKTPLYNIFIIEMILSLFIAVVVLVFSSFTTATKILEKRVIKHDIMKKMGINVTTIINLSAVESFIAAIIPSMLLGSIFGFSVIKPMLGLLSYGAEPYPLSMQYPLIPLLLSFLALPIILYISLTFNLRREFAKYSPTQLE
ncbi:MAG: hypothetical protein K9W46_01280 [Candidatus Heimdallarchaeum endolithica]|uniref:ABC3 transporter permease protein domain-containing protein n=1 Tax=Candidatus Heimdallarchaeum endolithica TaxID=2876572 RepID=A0A9Y1BRW0_9ARCH|nr:MAG: hypothetical protein K9W46_01280 [Candidatus Heimdallarchaeum endolithica]